MTNMISVINTAHTLMSLRDSGFSLSSAIGEVIDNAIQANATDIDVTFYQSNNGIDKLAVTDNGCGMDLDVLHQYLVIGRSTRYMSTTGIGKYGVGAKLAALNFGKKIRVWSRTETTSPFMYVEFDLDKAFELESKGETHKVGIMPPVQLDIDDTYADQVTDDLMTLVAWESIDRLQDGRVLKDTNQLTGWVTTELGRIFRNYISLGTNITLCGRSIRCFDPNMLLINSHHDYVLTKAYNKGNADVLKHYAPTIIANRVPVLTLGDDQATITVVLYPSSVTRRKGLGGDKLAKNLRVPQNQGQISFVREGREISYTNVPKIFSRGVVAQDRFIGITVEFPASFDSLMGVRAVKRGVEPFDSLRTEIRNKLKIYLSVAGKLLEKQWSDDTEQFDEALLDDMIAESETEESINNPKPLPSIDIVKLSSNCAKHNGYIIQEDSTSKNFVAFSTADDTALINLNKEHPMYQSVWAPLRAMSSLPSTQASRLDPIHTAKTTFNSINVMLAALSKSNLTADNLAAFSDSLTELVNASTGA